MTLYEEALMMLDQAKALVESLNLTDDAIVELVEEAVKRIESDHAALIADVAEAEKLLIRQTVEAVNTRAAEMPVSWGYRYEAGGDLDGDWRSHA